MQAKGILAAGTAFGLLLFAPVPSHAQENSIHEPLGEIEIRGY
jgi:hypothetical protein